MDTVHLDAIHYGRCSESSLSSMMLPDGSDCKLNYDKLAHRYGTRPTMTDSILTLGSDSLACCEGQ